MGAAAHNKEQRVFGSSAYSIVKDLRADAASLAFPIPIAGAQAAIEAKTLLMAQLDDHLLPRLAELSTPAIVVVAGSTGTGKSTIVNSLVNEQVSAAGIIRPTTTEPVLVAHPEDLEVLAKSPIAQSVHVVPSVLLPRGVALLDAPDLNSVREDNRSSARKLLESADLWLFVTTAQRYGDALPWKTLTSAVKRGTNLAMILNRVPDRTREAVEADLRKRLADNGLGNAELFVVPDQGPIEGLLDPAAVGEIGIWLRNLAGTDQAEEVIVSTLRGALHALPPRLTELANAIDDQLVAKKHIMVGARRLLVRTVKEIRTSVVDNKLLEGAASAAWSLFATKAKLDKAVDRSGYAKGSARTLKTREAAAISVTPNFREVFVGAGLDTVEESRASLRAGLVHLDGGTLIDVSEFPDRRNEIESVFGAWVSSVQDAVGRFAEQNNSKQVTAAQKHVGDSALGIIVVGAVLGHKEAEGLSRTLLGNESGNLIAEARTELADHYDRLVLGEYVHITNQLEELGLEEGASARIRVRLAELKKIR